MKNKIKKVIFAVLLILFGGLSEVQAHQDYAWSHPEFETPEYCNDFWYRGSYVRARGFFSLNSRKALRSSLEQLEEKFLDEQKNCDLSGKVFTFCRPISRDIRGGRGYTYQASLRYQCR